MPRGLPLTLWRATLTDLTKLVSLSAAVLVTVIAFAGAIKPLSDGVLQAGDAVRFILFAMPPMLAYALPFASGFASTLVYHRIAHDHEAVAAHAGGISHRSLLAPALAAAVGLSALLVALNESVIPSFLRQMQRLVTVDFARLVAQEISKGKAVELKGMMVFADRAQRVEPEEGVMDKLVLDGFAAVEVDRNGRPVTEATASSAVLWLMPGVGGDAPERGGAASGTASDTGAGDSVALLRLYNFVAVQEGKVAGGARDSVNINFPVPNTFSDNPKFLSFTELRALADFPERMNWIDARRRALAMALAERRAVDAIRVGLEKTGRARLVDERGRPLTIQAGGLRAEPNRWALLPPADGGPIRVDLMREGAAGGVAAAAIAPAATLSAEAAPDRAAGRLSFRLDLERARMRDAGDGNVADAPERLSIPMGGLAPEGAVAVDLLARSPATLLEAAAARRAATGPDGALDKIAGDLGFQIARLSRLVLSKQHERMAMAASCAVMVLTGAVTALRLSRKAPLTVYLFTFFPALATIVTISGGQQVTVQQGPVGLALMWSGVAGLLVYTAIVFRGLARH